MKQYSAFLVDLDGTLMVTDTISPRVARAVEEVSRLIPVSIATGRRSTDLLAYARKLGLSAPQIGDGGATLLDPTNGGLIWNSHLPEQRAEEIVNLIDNREIEFIATHPAGDATSIEQILHWDLTRISAMDIPESEADELVSRFGQVADLNVVKVYLHYNGWWAVDFTASGVHKGKAALRLARMLGIEPSGFIAAGDSFNDLPMLVVAGYRIAMGSAPDEMKAMADYVAPPVEEDGLAIAIEDVILPMLLAQSS